MDGWIYLFVKSGPAGMVEEEEEEEEEVGAQMEAHADGGAGEEMNEGDQEEDDEDMDVEPHVNGSWVPWKQFVLFLYFFFHVVHLFWTYIYQGDFALFCKMTQ